MKCDESAIYHRSNPADFKYQTKIY